MFYKRHFSIILFLFLLLCLLVIYYPAFHIDFFADDYFWIKSYIDEGFNGIKYNFNDDFFLPLSHLLQIAEIYIFGINASFIHFANYLMLALSGFLVFKNIKLLFSFLSFDTKDVNLIATYSSLFFVFSPYNTEVINWFTAQTYLFSTLFFLISLYLYLKFKLYQKIVFLFGSILLLLLSFLSKEISFFSFLIFITLEIVVFKETLTNKLKIISIYTSVTFFYFVLRFFFLNNIIGGYGNSIHLNFSLNLLLHNVISYNAKFLILYRYLMPLIHEVFTNNIIIIITAFSIIFVLITYYVFRIRKISIKSPLMMILLFSFLFFIFSLAPVINLETSFLKNIQSDRYGFLPSIFFSVFFVIGITILFRSNLKHVVAIFWLLFYSLFTYSTNLTWNRAYQIKEIFSNSIVSEIIKGNNKILIVNLPDNYDGVYLFRNALKECIDIKLANNTKYEIKFVALQNLSCSSKNQINLTVNNDTINFKTDSISNIIKLYNDTSGFYQKKVNLLVSSGVNNYKLAINKQSEYSIYYFSNDSLKKISKQ